MIESLQAARAAERRQALFYRGLATAAERAGQAALAERLQELHADEQHHLSRLTARLVELGAATPALEEDGPALPPLEEWEAAASEREAEEIRRYVALLAGTADAETRALLESIVEVEEMHREKLGGKWTLA